MADPRADDDLYVNEGSSFEAGIYYPGEPADRQEEERTKTAIKASSYPVMEDVANWFELQIANAPNITNVETKRLTINGVTYSRTVSIEAQVLAFQLLEDLLRDKANEFAEFREETR